MLTTDIKRTDVCIFWYNNLRYFVDPSYVTRGDDFAKTIRYLKDNQITLFGIIREGLFYNVET